MKERAKRLTVIIMALALVISMTPMIPGGNQAYAANATAITITDIAGVQTVIPYDADAQGEGYTYTAETNTLTLNQFTGQKIFANGDFNLHLIGENTLQIAESEMAGTSTNGLSAMDLNYSTPKITVTAAEDGVLNVIGENLTSYVKGIDANLMIVNGTINVDIVSSSSACGLAKAVEFKEGITEAADVNVKVETTGDASQGNTAVAFGTNMGLSLRNRANNVTINAEAIGEGGATALASYIAIDNAAPVINAKAHNPAGEVTSTHYALNGDISYMVLKEGGKVSLEGLVRVDDLGYQSNGNVVETTPANSQYYWGSYNGLSSTDMVALDLDGTPVEKLVFEHSETPSQLKYVGTGIVSVPQSKVGESLERIYLGNYIRGASNYLLDINGAATTVTYSISAGTLPAGMSLSKSMGYIGGKPTATSAATEVTVKVVDGRGTTDKTDDQTIEFAVPIEEIIEPDTFITVGDSQPVEMRDNGSGEGWTYDGETATLTLNNYTGGKIFAQKNFNLHLIGENTIQIADSETAGTSTSGLSAMDLNYSTPTITVSAAEDGVLNVVGKNLTTSVNGIAADLTIVNGTINVDVESSISVCGISRGVTFKEGVEEAATVNVRAETTGDASQKNTAKAFGTNMSLSIRNRANNVTINAEAIGDYGATALASYIAIDNAAPVINAKAHNPAGEVTSTHYAVYGRISYMTLKEGGKVSLEGIVRTDELAYQSNGNIIETTPANSQYYWGNYKAISSSGMFALALDGTPVEKLVFEHSETPSQLKYVGTGIVSVPQSKVGEDIERIYLGNYIRGASNYWTTINGAATTVTYSISEGTLPAGMSLSKFGYISGKPTTFSEETEITVKVVDGRGTTDKTDDQTIEFAVPIGRVLPQKPVTNITTDLEEIIIEQGEELTVKATVTPLDATIPDLVVSPSHNLISIVSKGEPVEGATEIKIAGNSTAGCDTLVIRSFDTGFVKNVPVYVKEATPEASQDDKNIINLAKNADYSINGTVYTSNGRGAIPILPSWRNNTVSIVKVNDEVKCYSDEQQLAITAQPITKSMIELEYYYVQCDGTAKEPKVTVTDGETVLTENIDYTVSYKDNVNAGIGKAIIEGQGIYQGTAEVTFSMYGISMENARISFGEKVYVYNGEEQIPDMTVTLNGKTLIEGTDYTVTCKDNIVAGPATVILYGQGIYISNKSAIFIIHPITLQDSNVTLEYTETTYDGSEKTPAVTVKDSEGNVLKNGTDYKIVKYSDNKKAGTATVTIEGDGNYEGTIVKNFVIKPCPHIWGDGKVTKAATCTEAGVKTFTCTVPDCGVTYTETIAKLGHSYSSSYTVDKKATMSENGSKSKHCTKCSAKTSVTSIPKVSSVKLSATAYTYNGKTKTPTVTVKDSKGKTLKNGTDYSVKYASGRKKIDKYKVTVTLKGAYSGSKNLYFTIGPKNPSSVKTTLYGYDDVKVSWSKVSGASGYVVYYKKASASSYKLLKTTTSTSYKKSNLDDGVKYDFKVVAYKTTGGDKCYNAGKTSSITTLKKVTGVKATKSSSKVKVSWTNIGGETGYQISQSTSKSKTNVVATYKTTSGKSKTISATKGKTYYYKVRAYKVVDGKKIYAPWSSVVKYKR